MTVTTMKNDARKARVKQTAEVFTPAWLVNQMLDKLPKTVWRKGKTFCDPAAGNGNMLIEVLKRKLAKKHDPLEALQSVYGVDIMQDNIRECRMRLLKIVSKYETITEEHISAVFQNIVRVNLKNHPLGSLEYNFDFPNKVNQNDVTRWMKSIHEDGILDEVSDDLPVEDEEFDKEGEENVFNQI